MKTTSDGFLVAAFCPLLPKQKILDLGCGNGDIGLKLISRMPSSSLMGIDICEKKIEQAINESKFQKIQERCHFEIQDIRNWHFAAFSNSFDRVVTNPPFFASDKSRPARTPERQTERQSDTQTIVTWFRVACACLKPGGILSLVWPANRLSSLLALIQTGISSTLILPVVTAQNKKPKRLILALRKSTQKIIQMELTYLHPLQFQGTERTYIETYIKQQQGIWPYLERQNTRIPCSFLPHKTKLQISNKEKAGNKDSNKKE